ncbi:MAG: Hg(II)-responsive transcriptional regulator [Cognaticolwellia aestuarii]
MSKKISPLTIGRLAKSANVNIETIRHYQRKGLIMEPEKPLGGFRHYPSASVDRIRFIKRAQHLGFSLEEIRQLLALGDQHCGDVQTLAQEKRDKIKQQIAGLLTIQTALDELISTCDSGNEANHCGFIDGLSQKGFLEN